MKDFTISSLGFPMAESKKVLFEIALPPDAVLPPLAGANWFHFSSVGSEIHMLVGSVNLLSLSQLASGGASEPQTIAPVITHRFLLSPVGFSMLKAQVDQISPSVQESSVVISRKGGS